MDLWKNLHAINTNPEVVTGAYRMISQQTRKG